MPNYLFRLPARFASTPVTVYNTADVQKATGTTDANALYTATLPTGDYYAKISYGYTSYKAAGEVDRGDLDNISEATLPALGAAQPKDTDPMAWRREATLPLTLPTPDGDPSVTHPDVVDTLTEYGLANWNGYRYWMGFTPYPGASRELPCVLVSNDRTTWIVPPGGSNPVVSQASISSAGYLWGSDTDLTILANGTMQLVYRVYSDDATPKERIYRRTTTDGRTWTAPEALVSTTGTAVQIMSPTIERIGDTYYMWSVNRLTTGVVERRTSSDALNWSAPTTVTLPTGGGADPWHIDIQYVNGTYYMLLDALTVGSAARLLFLTSTDGLTWVNGRDGTSIVTPADRHVSLSGIPTFDGGRRHYRSTFTPRGNGRWDVYVTGLPTSPRSGNADLQNNPWRVGLYSDVALPMAKYVPQFPGTSIGQPGIIVPPVSMLSAPSATVWPAAYETLFMRFSLQDFATFRYVNIWIDAQAGQIQAGVVRLMSQTSWEKVMDSGKIVTPAPGAWRADCGATELPPGDYAVFLYATDPTFQTRHSNAGFIGAMKVAANVTLTSTGVPTGGSFTGWTNRYFTCSLEADE